MTKSGGPTTTYAYDSKGATLSTTLYDGGTDQAIISSSSYDDAGRITSETAPGLSPVNYSYAYGANAGGVTNATYARTTTFADGGTRIEAKQLDGRPLSVSGTAVVEQDFSYALDATNSGYLDTTATVGGSGTRWALVVTDWAGRTVSSSHPGFTGQANFVQTNIYDTAGTGHLLEMDRTGYAPTKYQYDAMGSVVLSGLDLGKR